MSPSTLRRDVISAYGATFARIASWVIVSALVYRRLGADSFALLSFVRGTIGVLSYAAIGLAPAMIKLLAEARAPRRVMSPGDSSQLDYFVPSAQFDPVQRVFANGVAISIAAFGIAFVLLLSFAQVVGTSRIAALGPANPFVFVFGIGILLRLLSDPPAAVLQTSGRITLDNYLVIGAELLWALLSAINLLGRSKSITMVGGAFAVASAALLVGRWMAARTDLPPNEIKFLEYLHFPTLKRLLSFGFLVIAAQLADYLYAPTDFVLIAWLLHPSLSATYGPAIQIDGGLLLLVSALSTVLLPRAAIAHANENRAALRSYYIKGTLASTAVLIVAAAGAWAISPWLFRLWFGNSMPATRAILPLVLISTLFGGSSIVGRSILIGMGKVAPFTVSVLIAGIGNVLLSWLFVTRFDMGLRGIILGTIIAVVARAGIWMPWYVMRTLRQETITETQRHGDTETN